MKIIVLGGRGFVGEAVVEALQHHDVYTFDRHEGGKNHRQGSITSLRDVEKAIKGMDVVINLVGLSPIRKPKIPYEKIHVGGVQHIIDACQKNNVKRLVHMSALGADSDSPLMFLKTKGEADDLIRESGLDYVIISPSIIFDKENELVEMAKLFSLFRVFPNIRAKVQPIYRKDVATLFRLAAEGNIKEDKIEVGGPDVMTVFEMGEVIFDALGRSCYPLPLPLVKLGIWAGSLVGMYNGQMVQYLKKDNVADMRTRYIEYTPYTVWVKESIS